jgi:hypothetical protein
MPAAATDDKMIWLFGGMLQAASRGSRRQTLTRFRNLTSLGKLERCATPSQGHHGLVGPADEELRSISQMCELFLKEVVADHK